jgi:hypothetical protein
MFIMKTEEARSSKTLLIPLRCPHDFRTIEPWNVRGNLGGWNTKLFQAFWNCIQMNIFGLRSDQVKQTLDKVINDHKQVISN